MKNLLTEWRKYQKRILQEDADPAKLDPGRFPIKLSDVVPKAAQTYAKTGAPELDKAKDDDTIPVANGERPVGTLKPSQTSMMMEKAMAFVLQMLSSAAGGPGKLSAGGDLGAFISNDDYIMDGHHRWIATGMINPALSVGGYIVDWPGEQLVAVLNTITKGKLGVMQGKPASGGFDQFNEGMVRQWLMQYLKKGVWGNMSPEDALKAVEKFTGQKGEAAIEPAVQKIVQNLGSLTLAAPSWAPARPDMPVIDDKKTGVAAKALAQGEIDVNKPYGVGAHIAAKKAAPKQKLKQPLPKE